MSCLTFNQLQKRTTEPAQVKTAIDNFEKCIADVKNKIDDIINESKTTCIEPQGNERRRRNNSSHDHQVAALEVCDNIVNYASDRFKFKDYLVAASLFSPNALENTVTNFFRCVSKNHATAWFPSLADAADITIPLKKPFIHSSAQPVWWDEECTHIFGKRKEALVANKIPIPNDLIEQLLDNFAPLSASTPPIVSSNFTPHQQTFMEKPFNFEELEWCLEELKKSQKKSWNGMIGIQQRAGARPELKLSRKTESSGIAAVYVMRKAFVVGRAAFVLRRQRSLRRLMYFQRASIYNALDAEYLKQNWVQWRCFLV
ncbi:unnamed protein product [Acanthoscelides obtectus]|uniref:Uncharacterized protein n=1 Tax=Acanthoscelides obtectus TaxID=200917 RepID=A0A9P0PK42_ACAOB|nr:unnamed protein product [Acanthoscelides obtectus]CAK1635879.1 hypothetical protein AOBTE_LOCUS9586 [Acanthoscelides obtectus]